MSVRLKMAASAEKKEGRNPEGSFNRPVVHRLNVLMDAIDKRPANKPLITVCNHNSLIDDPLLAYMMTWRQVFSRSAIRWLLGAKNVCYQSYKSSLFFQLGKVLPVVRGDGVYQYGMDFCVDRLNEGDWVHLYPEAKINPTKEFMRIKWGVGRLIADSKISPVVLPYWHVGMDNILPNKKPYVPQVGKVVTVVIGDPMDFEMILKQMRQQNKTEDEIRKHVTDRIQDEFARLKAEAEDKHLNVVNTRSEDYT